MRDINSMNPSIPYEIRLETSIRIRDYSLVANNVFGDNFIIDVYNNKDVFRKADKVAITIFHPSKSNPTHFMSRDFPVFIGEKEFQRNLQLMKEEFEKKFKSEG